MVLTQTARVILAGVVVGTGFGLWLYRLMHRMYNYNTVSDKPPDLTALSGTSAISGVVGDVPVGLPLLWTHQYVHFGDFL
jgi:hypothetical protein